MRVSAGTDHAGDGDGCTVSLPCYEIYDKAVIMGMDPAVAFPEADRADFQLRAEGCHKGIKQGFCGRFYSDKLAIQPVLSYHTNTSAQGACLAVVELKMTAFQTGNHK